MRISIAMATYNGAAYLQEQLDSFLDQTRRPDELVVCDDGSTDRTLQILANFSIKAPFPVSITHNDIRLGHIRNFEKALSLCNGDVIALSDQDDVWFEDKLAAVESVFQSDSDAMVAINDQIITDENLTPTSLTKLGNTLSAGLPESYFITGCCTSMRAWWRDFVLPFPDGIPAHDSWVNTLAHLLKVRVLIRRPLQFYRRHNSNLSFSPTSSKKPVTPWHTLRMYGLNDARRGWKAEIKSLELYINRLRYLDTGRPCGELTHSAKAAVHALERKIAALEERAKIVSVSRWRRVPLVLNFFAQNGYAGFAGWRSAAKDLLRR